LGNFTMGQNLPTPTSVTPPPPPEALLTPTTPTTLGNPLVGQTDPQKNVTNPLGQNGPQNIGPLPVVHAPQIPR
jgi:hypothetical protein